MGREIRRVPPNYVHPKWTEKDADSPHLIGRDRSFYDNHITTALAEWLANFDRVRRGDFTEFEAEYLKGDPAPLATWMREFDSPPDPKYYRPWRDEEATWFQLWQTVSEGSPVSPPFATLDELAAYLAENGDLWDQERAKDRGKSALFGMAYGKPGWGMEAARAFVEAGYAPTMMVTGGRVFESKDVPLEMAKRAGQ